AATQCYKHKCLIVIITALLMVVRIFTIFDLSGVEGSTCYVTASSKFEVQILIKEVLRQTCQPNKQGHTEKHVLQTCLACEDPLKILLLGIKNSHLLIYFQKFGEILGTVFFKDLLVAVLATLMGPLSPNLPFAVASTWHNLHISSLSVGEKMKAIMKTTPLGVAFPNECGYFCGLTKEIEYPTQNNLFLAKLHCAILLTQNFEKVHVINILYVILFYYGIESTPLILTHLREGGWGMEICFTCNLLNHYFTIGFVFFIIKKQNKTKSCLSCLLRFDEYRAGLNMAYLF
ncbi:hypothetical protein ACJX0J_005407, partial [Zea mays]